MLDAQNRLRWIGGTRLWGHSKKDHVLSLLGILPVAIGTISGALWYDFQPLGSTFLAVILMSAIAIPIWVAFVWFCVGLAKIFRVAA